MRVSFKRHLKKRCLDCSDEIAHLFFDASTLALLSEVSQLDAKLHVHTAGLFDDYRTPLAYFFDVPVNLSCGKKTIRVTRSGRSLKEAVTYLKEYLHGRHPGGCEQDQG